MPLKDLKMPVKLKMKGQKNAPDNCSHYFIELLNTEPLNIILLWAAVGEW